MCRLCDDPTGEVAEVVAFTRELMVRHGWAVQGVEAEGPRSEYAYTVGLTECGLPELVVTGMELAHAAAILNRVAAHCVHHDPPLPGERLNLGDGPALEVVEVACPDAHLDVAVALFGHEIRALQLAWTDRRNGWPWEPGGRGQPLLGPRRGA